MKGQSKTVTLYPNLAFSVESRFLKSRKSSDKANQKSFPFPFLSQTLLFHPKFLSLPGFSFVANYGSFTLGSFGGSKIGIVNDGVV